MPRQHPQDHLELIYQDGVGLTHYVLNGRSVAHDDVPSDLLKRELEKSKASMAKFVAEKEQISNYFSSGEMFSLTIKDGRIVGASKLTSENLNDKPDIKIEGKPLGTYPGNTLKEKIQAEMRDVIAQQEWALKKNPQALIHVYVSPQAFGKVVEIMSEHNREDSATRALNDFVHDGRERNGARERQPLARRERAGASVRGR
jgi:hypothetical protein